LKLTCAQVRVQAHELHIALGKWESEYFGTAPQNVGAAHELQVLRVSFLLHCSAQRARFGLENNHLNQANGEDLYVA
jgi:hypothetical protein